MSEVAQSQGWTIHADATVRGGWPVAAAIELPGFTLTADPTAFPGGLVWSAGRIRVQLPFAAPKTLHVFAEGQQDLRLAGLPAIPFQAGTMDLEAALDGDAAADAVDRGAAGRTALRDRRPSVRATMLVPLCRRRRARCKGVTVPGGIGRALGPSVDAVHLRAALTRPIPPGPLRRHRRAPGAKPAAGSMRRNSACTGVRSTSPGHAVLASMTRLQPQGDGVLAVTGAAAALDALAQWRACPPAP